LTQPDRRSCPVPRPYHALTLTVPQLYELLRKRWIASSRDLKGLFFQIIFPAIQIILILAILTVQVNNNQLPHATHIVLAAPGPPTHLTPLTTRPPDPRPTAYLAPQFNPAGHTVRINADLFPPYLKGAVPNVIIAGNNINTKVRDGRPHGAGATTPSHHPDAPVLTTPHHT